MSDIVLFAVGSRICIDVVESCRRNGQSIAAAVRNLPGDVYMGADILLLEAADVPAEIAVLPFLLPLFDPKNRRTALASAQAHGLRTPAQLVDRSSVVADTCRIGDGAYVNAGCVIGGGTMLDQFVFCNRGANIGHHCRIGAFASIGPGAILAGLVEIGADCMIGAGAILLPQVKIGAGALIAPGAVVNRNVPAGGFAAGNPARILMRRPEGV